MTLNVWKPAGAKEGDNLPVAIYIHCGGNYYNVRFSFGIDSWLSNLECRKSAQGFPMQGWVNTTKGQIVAVNIQYRVSIFDSLHIRYLLTSTAWTFRVPRLEGAYDGRYCQCRFTRPARMIRVGPEAYLQVWRRSKPHYHRREFSAI